MMKEYTDLIAFAMVSARSRQLSDDLFKIAHGTILACETRRLFHFGFLELIGKTTCDIVNRLNGTIARPRPRVHYVTQQLERGSVVPTVTASGVGNVPRSPTFNRSSHGPRMSLAAHHSCDEMRCTAGR